MSRKWKYSWINIIIGLNVKPQSAISCYLTILSLSSKSVFLEDPRWGNTNIQTLSNTFISTSFTNLLKIKPCGVSSQRDGFQLHYFDNVKGKIVWRQSDIKLIERKILKIDNSNTRYSSHVRYNLIYLFFFNFYMIVKTSEAFCKCYFAACWV